MSPLAQLATALASGKVRVVDLTNTLSPDFPVIVLPPEFGQCAPFRMEELSRYDANGPAWYWNNISMNEHTGTHFDAPAHWVTGKDLPANTVDAIPAQDLVAPAVVIDISANAEADADFVITRRFLDDWETRQLTAMAKNPADRYLTASEFAKDLTRFLEDRPIHAKRPGPIARSWKLVRRHRHIATAVGVFAALLLTVLVGWQWQQWQHQQSIKTSAGNEIAAARASLQAQDFTAARQHLADAQRQLKDAGRRLDPLRGMATQLVSEIKLGADARHRLAEFQRVHRSLHSSLREERLKTRDTCIELLRQYGVLDNNWNSNPDLTYLTDQQVSQLKRDIAESLFLVGWLEIQLYRDREPDRQVQSYRKALDYWLRIDKVYADPIPALHLWIGQGWERVGEPKLAANARETAARLEDKHALDYFIRGEFHREKDEDEQAFECLTKAVRADPGHIWSLMALAHVQSQLGDSDVAEAVFTHAIDRHPSSRAAYYGRGVSLLYQGKYELAVEDFDRVHELNPQDYLGSFWAGMTLREKGDYASALERLKLAASINSGSFWVRYETAIVYQHLGQSDEALAQLDATLDVTEEIVSHHQHARRIHPNALLCRARIHRNAGGQASGMEDVKRAVDSVRNYPTRVALRDVAEFLLSGPVEFRDPTVAVELANLRLSIWKKQNRRDPLYLLGLAQYENGEFQAAIDTLIQVKSMGLDQRPGVHFVLAAALWKNGQKEQAQTWLTRGTEDGVLNYRRKAEELIKSPAATAEETNAP